jgi:polysaccharide pyruvyl transferase WcaK-like protein
MYPGRERRVIVHIHIGHHFFGSGNFGDDLMLAGFLRSLGAVRDSLRLTCCTPFDRASQQMRFPEIEWLEYTPGLREEMISSCDCWLGLGDTPFQTDVGRWFLEHLGHELVLCRRFGKPMFFLGVGLNNPEALDDPVSRDLLRYSSHIWARDELSAEKFSDICRSGKVTSGADLAHSYLAGTILGPCESGVVGYVLNFEDASKFSPPALATWVKAQNRRRHRWLFQEVRRLMGSETDLFDQLAPEIVSRFDSRYPDYGKDTLQSYLERWGVPEYLVTSRYHSAIVGCWLGCRVVTIERNLKIAGCARQLKLSILPALTDAGQLQQSIERSSRTDPAVLAALAVTSQEQCREFISKVCA